MKITVIGANGQLGSDVVKAFAVAGDEVSSLTHADIDLASMDSVAARMQELGPEVVVNTAAMHHVEN